MNGRCTGLNHRFHQLEGVQHAAEARLRIRDDRQEVVSKARIARFDSSGPLDLIRTAEGIVDPIHHRRYGVSRIERLIRVHAGGEVGVRRDLPAGEINRLNTRLRLLQRLTAGQRAEAVDVALFRATVQQLPHFRRTVLCQRAFRIDRAA